jgi:hypothetical protein
MDKLNYEFKAIMNDSIIKKLKLINIREAAEDEISI